MTSLIAKADIENELQITLATGYTDAIISDICSWADSMLRMKTNRTGFTGSAADIAKHAELCMVIDRLATSNPDLVKLAIASISENGGSISFSNGKTINSYRDEAKEYISDLKLVGSKDWNLTFADTQAVHSTDDPGLFDEV